MVCSGASFESSRIFLQPMGKGLNASIDVASPEGHQHVRRVFLQVIEYLIRFDEVFVGVRDVFKQGL
jgi:hypothetical protein